ncbi:unnamed protein product [Caenorhabditis angaria]|uniref:Uncharacterized protein n=1 Tax=Caenorhabditis angaria TaxID=860376 RepID=A0A9P1IZW8_9PELO|nr:unnamed protein product [Caenorhabditis angaria]
MGDNNQSSSSASANAQHEEEQLFYIEDGTLEATEQFVRFFLRYDGVNPQFWYFCLINGRLDREAYRATTYLKFRSTTKRMSGHRTLFSQRAFLSRQNNVNENDHHIQQTLWMGKEMDFNCLDGIEYTSWKADMRKLMEWMQLGRTGHRTLSLQRAFLSRHINVTEKAERFCPVKSTSLKFANTIQSTLFSIVWLVWKMSPNSTRLCGKGGYEEKDRERSCPVRLMSLRKLLPSFYHRC